ncbi:MAG: MarR family transcriptional regulator [Mycobacterium sp.]
MTDDGWLNPQEQRAWRSFTAMRQQLQRHLERHLQQETGLSGSDYEILVNLSEAPGGRMRAFELAAATDWEKSRLSHHLSRMAKRGLLSREAEGTRYPDVVLTAAGHAAIQAAAPAHVARVRELFVGVLGTDRLMMLGEAADEVLAALEEHRRADSTGGPIADFRA